MIRKPLFYLKRLHSRQFITMAMAKGSCTAGCREIDPLKPETWEFSAFSQNGEDGIIDYLSRRVKSPNRYFIEIGASKGMENNSSWLGLARKYNGVWVEGSQTNSSWAAEIVAPLNLGIECICMRVTPDNVKTLKEKSLFMNPDVFALDIDGIDYYVMKEIFNAGFRPKICIVEYNSVFGPEKAETIKYNDNFNYQLSDPNGLYFGVSIQGWRKFFSQHGYHFISVDSNGVNAFFVDPGEFETDFLERIRGIEFQENFYHSRKFKSNWKKQYQLIQHKEFVTIG